MKTTELTPFALDFIKAVKNAGFNTDIYEYPEQSSPGGHAIYVYGDNPEKLDNIEADIETLPGYELVEIEQIYSPVGKYRAIFRNIE